MEPQNKITPSDVLSEYYSMKNTYEQEYRDNFITPLIKNKGLSKRELRKAITKLPKPKCLNCGEQVGMIFKITYLPDNLIRVFTVKCGSLENPCSLNIQLNYSLRKNLETLIRESVADVEQLKQKIIIEKNNALFFGNSVLDKFEKLSVDLKNETETAGFYMETDVLRNNNPEKRKLISRLIDEFGKECILPFKKMIHDYLSDEKDDESNEPIITQAVNFYVHEMIPKLNQLRELKYDVNMVEFNDITNTYTLVQLPTSIENREYYFKTDDEVISYVKGVKQTNKNTKTRKKSLKNDVLVTGIPKQPKKKTLKRSKLADNIVLEQEPEPEPEIPAENPESEPMPELINISPEAEIPVVNDEPSNILK